MQNNDKRSEAQPITFPTSGVINTFRWKLCPGCGHKVWLTKRGKLCRHLPMTGPDCHGFAVHSAGIDPSVTRCDEVNDKDRDAHDLREAVKLSCGCDCEKCVRVLSMLADEGLGWVRPASPCALARPS